MSYPILANWIRFKKVSDDEYLVIDQLNDKKIKVEAYTVWFVSQLDGKTDPYSIDRRLTKRQVDLFMERLEEKEIVRDRRFLSKSIFYLLFTVWRPRVTPMLRMVSRIINKVIACSWLPAFAFAIYYYFTNSFDLVTDYIFLGSIVGMLVGIVLHELGHMFAGLGYGAGVFEIGVMLQLVMPGAYVLMNNSKVKGRMKRIQISAAGIEMNLLLAALSLILSANIPLLSGFFLGAAIQNVFLALLNLTFINGLDGTTIISELLGVEDLVEKAKSVTKSSWRRKLLRRKGVLGNVIIASCYAIRVVQLAMPLVLVINVLGVISWFL